MLPPFVPAAVSPQALGPNGWDFHQQLLLLANILSAQQAQQAQQAQPSVTGATAQYSLPFAAPITEQCMQRVGVPAAPPQQPAMWLPRPSTAAYEQPMVWLPPPMPPAPIHQVPMAQETRPRRRHGLPTAPPSRSESDAQRGTRSYRRVSSLASGSAAPILPTPRRPAPSMAFGSRLPPTLDSQAATRRVPSRRVSLPNRGAHGAVEAYQVSLREIRRMYFIVVKALICPKMCLNSRFPLYYSNRCVA